jgi:two-component system, NtrC family, response regulator GlrR
MLYRVFVVWARKERNTMMIGRSPAFTSVLALLEKIASRQATLLIEGETGTGKELVARNAHYHSPRRHQPFIPVNCGALPDMLIENELFGHSRGAYTDARQDQPGLVELADKGTLFLDEVDTLTQKAQVALLRFLQDQRYRPLGAREERSADVRIIAASNRSLEQAVADGTFRADLLYRLRLLYLHVPPLRERRGDAALLAEHFIEAAVRRFGGEAKRLSAASARWLDAYDWPGNVRELENLIYRSFLICDEAELEVVRPNSLAGLVGMRQDESELNYVEAKAKAIAAFEVEYLSRAMRNARGNVTAAAKLIGTERRHLGRLLKKYCIQTA